MYNLIKLNLARNALRYIVRTYKIQEMYIPYYLCGVIRRALIKEQCKPIFYHIDDDFMPLLEFPADAFILYPNYFGICDKNVEILSKKYSHLLIDSAHAFYNEPKGFAAFNSARKFLPVYNGSYLWIKDTGESYSQEKEFYPAPITEEEIYKNEKIFENTDIELLNENTAEEISGYDLLKKRKERFLELHKLYGENNLLQIDEKVNSPFCYPCLLKDAKTADKLVDELKRQGYKIYRYWEEMPSNFSEYKFFSCLVPIPIN